MENPKKCPVNMLEYLRDMPKDRVLVDDIAQVVWTHDSQNKVFPTTYEVYKYLVGQKK